MELSAEQKRHARVSVIRTVIARMEEGMRRWGVEPPPSTGADYTGETAVFGHTGTAPSHRGIPGHS